MPFITVADGLIRSSKLEFNLAAHCNFSCAECSHFSPHLAPTLADYDTFVRDLGALAKVYRVKRFRFVGGEPLLHKQILDYIEAVRTSGIADSIQICSNGSLLHKAEDQLFRAIDSLSISWYPDARCDAEKIRLAQHKCRQHGVKLKVERIDHFRLMQLDEPIHEQRLVDRVYRSCQIAHSWGCQTFLDGYFYLCSRPLFLGSYLGLKGIDLGHRPETEGVALHEDRLQARLLAYLRRTDPLPSCSYCLGTVGQHRPWRSLDKQERRNPPLSERDAAAHVDHARMRYLLAFSRMEGALLSMVPSQRLARVLAVIKNLPIGD
jgi:organic radical activating enzyme